MQRQAVGTLVHFGTPDCAKKSYLWKSTGTTFTSQRGPLQHFMDSWKHCVSVNTSWVCACVSMVRTSSQERYRGSDLRRVHGFLEDINEQDGRISGYLECRTRSHKTARLVAKRGIAMPLVAPVWGISTPAWGLAFVRLCKLSGRPLESIDSAPLLMAPTPEGSWSCRSTTTSEAGKWLRHLLSRMEVTVGYTTAHTLKGIVLVCEVWDRSGHSTLVGPSFDRQSLGRMLWTRQPGKTIERVRCGFVTDQDKSLQA